MPEFLKNGRSPAAATVVLAHGAGAAMDSPFMERVALGLGEAGLSVVRFEFPYMRRRRLEGGRRPPDRQPLLLETWRAAIETLGGPAGLIIGGKSMGGRMASLITGALEAEGRPPAGLCCLGYPFHPPGRPDKTRTGHLEHLTTPTLILQGQRDPFGGPGEVAGYALSPAIGLHWLADGDHGFRPRKKSGRSEAQNLGEAIEKLACFARRCVA